MIGEYFKLAFGSLKERKVRSSLTVLGISIAILTIFVLLSITIGLNEAVKEQFEKLGTDKFFIEPKGRLGAPGTGGAVEITLEDVKFVEKIKGVKRVSYYIAGSAKVEFLDDSRYVFGVGVPVEKEKLELYFSLGLPDVDKGRLFKKGDSGKVVVGDRYKVLFDKPVKPGNKIKINDKEFEVVGILDPIGSPPDDAMVQIPEEDFRELYNIKDRVDFIIVEADESEDINSVAERVERQLMKQRDVDEKTRDFNLSTPEELLSVFGNVLNILTAFLVGIGTISLLVGGIGIANTMYTSVLERNKEIGTMKAIGAKNSDVLIIFLIESGILGLLGGVLGLGAGIGIAKLIEYIAFVSLGSSLLKASINLIIVAGVLGFAFFIGVISGILPALQASKLKPADALRWE